jgi:hypothetical protein
LSHIVSCPGWGYKRIAKVTFKFRVRARRGPFLRSFSLLNLEQPLALLFQYHDPLPLPLIFADYNGLRPPEPLT